MIFYLKVNRRETYSCRNLQNWLDIVQAYEGAKAFIQCDNEELKEMIVHNTNCLTMKDTVSFIETQWEDKDLGEITARAANDKWAKASYAHLTTFLHARQNGYDKFWNIDADDTVFCMSPEHTVKCLKDVEEYAGQQDIKLFSLDMHFSDFFGCHWTYGVTYTDNSVNWLEYMKEHMSDGGFQVINLDWYTTYLRTLRDYKIETFYFENLKFIHYSEDFFKRPANSGMRHWKDGNVIFPILAYGYGRTDIGILPIAKDCIRLEEDISDEEAGEFLLEHSVHDDKLVIMEWERKLGVVNED
jgi:hypothetical protein